MERILLFCDTVCVCDEMGLFDWQAGSANLSNINTASQLLLSLREQENLTRNSSLASAPKVSRAFFVT